ncbi:MAG: alpha-galactosidase [uncultured Chloroflexia bacterium]|uniref:Alpha-galactosidase n=1 Tax=uncultured Chloroflexia bacterium TaxID=1672391 RepID=A0A6J4IZ05_9CHLR|nr:MAG: alpha-galactosidase [uncultured Chloroflexia bacterium]
MRICDAVARYSRVKVVGLCHGILIGYGLVGTLLQDYLEVSPHVDAGERWMQSFQRSVDRLDIRAAGLNHFIWMLGLHDRQTGEDLYPLLREKAVALPAAQMPLNRQLLQTFGLFPLLDASHLCEYLPWMSDPVTRSWEKYGIHLWDWDAAEKGREQGHAEIARMADGRMEIDHLRSADSEGALEIVENIAAAGTHYHLAVNLPNRGYIANLPDGAIVELPGVVSGSGVHGIGMGSLPEPIAELCRREISVMRLCVDAAIHGDRQSALQCLLLDPVMRDIDTAQQILDAYLDAYREHLPQFWR